MLQRSLVKYKVGLAAIGLFAVVVLVLVLIQAGATKQDKATYNRASSMANTLNNYIASSSVIPESLAGAGIHDASTNISYQKLSSTSYKFCVDYKTTSSGFDATSVATDLATAQSNLSGYSGSGSYYGSTDTAYLYLNPTHHKGENCQTIKPTLYNSFNNSSSSNSQDPYAKCDSIQDNTAWQQCVDNATNSQNSQNSTLTN